jgi:excinuclease UvrABC nuclease subunit
MGMIADKIAGFPTRPGVYLMRDKSAKVIYIGKAKDLRARVRAYFNNSDERSQIQFLVRRVEDIEVLVTSNDKEALILENNLIKQYKPRYNIRLKDDKSYSEHKGDDAAPLAAYPGDPQDRQGRQPLLRSLFFGGGGAGDHRHHRKAFFAAQLHRS